MREVMSSAVRRCLALGFLLCASSLWGHSDVVRIATLNLQNYLSMDRAVEGHWRRDYPKPEAEKYLIRRLIRSINPDILLLQEIGSLPYLKELRSDLSLEGMDYPHYAHLSASDEIRHLAVLSKRRIDEVVKHVDLGFKYLDGRETVKRGMLEVSFADKEGLETQIFVVHLKSRWSDDDRDPESNLRRTREAEACRNRIIERTVDSGKTRYIVAGDFNDHPNSGTMRRFSHRGELTIGNLLSAADRRGHVWTHYYARESSYMRVDGFVISPDLLPNVVEERGYVAEWPIEGLGSDHRMVYFDLDFSGSSSVSHASP